MTVLCMCPIASHHHQIGAFKSTIEGFIVSLCGVKRQGETSGFGGILCVPIDPQKWAMMKEKL